MGLAMMAALASHAVGRAGRPLSVALSLFSLATGLVAGFMLVPRLLARIRWRALESLQLFVFTGLGVFFTLLVAVLAVAALNTGNNLLFLVVSVLLASYLVSGMMAKLSLSGLAVSCRFPEEIHATAPSTFVWVVQNEKRRLPTFSLRAEIFLQALDGTCQSVSLYFPVLEVRQTGTRTLKQTFACRGVYRVVRVNLTTRFPFGFFQRGRVLHPNLELLVYPAVHPIDEFRRLLPFLQGERAVPLKGQGDSLYQIREFRGEDSIRRLHWPSSAKAGRLMVRDFMQDQDSCVEICLDNTRPHPSFERAVILAASVTVYFQGQGAEVRLVTADGASDPALARSLQQAEILGMLARVAPRNVSVSFWERLLAAQISVCPGEVFRIILTAADKDAVPPSISRFAHIVNFDQL
jgi:uncharacterized protein (DUF58 family)